MKGNGFVVFQSDFGLEECTVVQCSGVAYTLAKRDEFFHLEHACHEISLFNIHEASFRITQALHAWPENTTYVSVIDPTVGSERQSVVAVTNDNKFIVTPNNGALSDIVKTTGIKALREIDDKHRRAPEGSATFDGRDLYIPIGTLLATNQMTFEEVGRELPLDSVVMLPENVVTRDESGINTNVSVLDKHFGSLWTNICIDEFKEMFDFNTEVRVIITKGEETLFEQDVPFGESFFAAKGLGEPVIYTTELRKVGVALFQESFAKRYNVDSGFEYKISFKKI
ncbi:hypothetical protein OAA_08110 [Vibrio cyclitrophicus 1F175]|nr:SAM-dependent chlorinase/fluorinase [Vibrio cyclitrophicus]OEF24932.1 hypothetical protein OA9_16890 [Vibrio cyclitrophicus 1F97]OEF33288.1 hypothetical protein OA7_14495 [Vibrio cyclitrophicus 1F53]OEF43375.1 hypothetical protein OAC_09865 [Vibrio cyclitrophicus 1F273]OEF66698.1 hypothetical protein OAA_08110 [Vibrio cyclitrophicus 1F175]PMH36268.1 hypothetical protein BCU72_08915 [Vibrio cyclitrophicus]